ncbi:helix-turn-helix domain-containing protein [Aromatoleum toluvorans]|uniref:Helix-turn-helix domain-containing protein n=1 Tax=Aromatoleum toluvorans TaxID=92002 RepID=A0ABX1PT02_9RHOO|nr:helix-turn-helix transcriptional regulator [Aromatoleum toluvorans]NMG42587.1 helix-turn-helix domain-containing protein [Aromatoleum toluvorans]
MSAPEPPVVAPLTPESPCLTAKQAAAYLHLNEKKLYELANSGEVPAARVGGKWLFPRRLLDEWLLEQAHGGVLTDRLLIAGGDDALLAAAVRLLATELGAEAFVAYSPTATLTGLEQLARRRVDLSMVHWGGAEHSLAQHATLLRAHPGHARWTLVRLGLREQGVLLRPGLGIDQLETLVAFDVRWAMRGAGSGAGHFLASALRARGLHADDCSAVATAAGEREAAALLLHDGADCTPGTRATATEFGLDFLPLGWEALDLALPKEIYFRHLFQRLLARLGGAELGELARQLGGYELTALGQVSALD